MAKVIAPLLSLEARGQFHNTLVFQHRRQGICKFKYPVKYLKTPLQIKMRYIYGQCVGTWRCLTDEQKAEIIDAYHDSLKTDGIKFELGDNFGAMINVMFGQL